MKELFRGLLLTAILAFLCLNQSTTAQTRTFKSFSRNMPTLARNKITEYHSDRRDIDLLAFSRDDQWVLVAGNYKYYSSVSYFDNIGLRPKITENVNAGRQIDAIAFAPNNAWLIIAENYQWYSSGSYFNSIGLRPKLLDLRSQNKRIASVTIGPQGCWVVITQDGGIHYSSNLRTTIPKLWYLLVDCKTRSKRPVQFVNIVPPTSNGQSYPNGVRWVLVADDYHWSDRWTTEATGVMDDYCRRRYRIKYVALRPSGGWSVISNIFFAPKPSNQLANKLERGLRVNGSTSKFLLQERMKFHNVPGVSIAVIKNDRVEIARGYGTERAGSQDPVLASRTRFPAASMSKVIAGMTWNRLAASRSNLDLNDRLEEVVRNFNLPNNSDFMRWYNASLSRDRRIRNITIQQLLTNTSGLNQHGIGQDALGSLRTLDDILMDGSVPRVILSNAPGAVWDYSGGGFTVAEALLEAITGQDAANYMDQVIFTPLNMHRTLCVAPTGAYYAVGHSSSGNALPRGDCPGEFAGGVITTPWEYAQFVLALMNDGKVGTRQVFPKADVDRILTNSVRTSYSYPCNDARCTAGLICFGPAGTTTRRCALPYRNVDSGSNAIRYYGMGVDLVFSVDANNYASRFSHGGSQRGYNCLFWVYKGQDEALVVMTNGTGSWTDSDGNTRGAAVLINEIRASFDNL